MNPNTTDPQNGNKNQSKRAEIGPETENNSKITEPSKATSKQSNTNYCGFPKGFLLNEEEKKKLQKNRSQRVDGTSTINQAVENINGKSVTRSDFKEGSLSEGEEVQEEANVKSPSPKESNVENANSINKNYTEEMKEDTDWDEMESTDVKLLGKTQKKLMFVEWWEKISEAVRTLEGSIENDDNKEIEKILCSIDSLHYEIWKETGDMLADKRFPEIGLQMLKKIHGEENFQDSPNWKTFYLCLRTLKKYSGVSFKFGKSIAEHEGVQFFTNICGHEPYIRDLHLKNVHDVIMTSMCILHNILRVPDLQQSAKNKTLTEVVLKIVNIATDDKLKVSSFLTLSDIVETEDNYTLMDETGIIKSCVEIIDKALASEDREYLGFKPYEIMEGLSKLAVNDENKQKIVEAGGLPIFQSLLNGSDNEEQSITARIIGTISNDKKVCQEINKFPEITASLENLKNSKDKNVNKNANQALKAIEIPEVHLMVSIESQPLKCGYTVILEAEIKSGPGFSVTWEKNKENIQNYGTRFLEDNSEKRNAKLVIQNVTCDDSGEYSVTITNEKGSAKGLKKITIEENSTIFISGPAVVSASETIQLKTVYPPNSIVTCAKWTNKVSNNETEIDFNKPGYRIRTSTSVPITQEVEITDAKENKGAYQLYLNNKKSNKIDVIVDDSGNFSTEKEGNCLRFFALQSVSAKALRMKIKKVPENFQTVWKRFKEKSKHGKISLYSILPKDTTPSLDDLDISLMYSLVRNCIKLKAPSNGWGKMTSPNHTNTADDIERIHFYRNKICHLDISGITTKDFNEYTLDLIGAIQRLSDDDEQIRREIFDVLNRKIIKGEVLQQMEYLKEFQEEANKTETLVKELECHLQNQKVNGENSDIRFHHNYESSIVMCERCTIAVNMYTKGTGICFMNRPIDIGEQLFLNLGVQALNSPHSLRIALIHKNPQEINLYARNEREEIRSRLQSVEPFSNTARISLNEDASLLIYWVDSNEQYIRLNFKTPPIDHPLYLAFEISNCGTFVQISRSNSSFADAIKEIPRCNDYMKLWMQWVAKSQKLISKK